MAETDLIKLYSQRILALAADIPLAHRLDHPQGSATKRAPLCGSTVTVDVELEGDRITGFGQDVKACALGQAAASVVGRNILGCSREETQAARDQLAELLQGTETAPKAPFEDLEVLRPAREFKNRHASILLCLDATLDAIDAAREHVIA
ncbi:MAG: iron-sulfur cluster assembly scaffold protein [Mangrovicoccus sp.]